MKKISMLEFTILAITVIIIFFSIHQYIGYRNHDRAIFIACWPPTLLMFLVYLNSKNQTQGRKIPRPYSNFEIAVLIFALASLIFSIYQFYYKIYDQAIFIGLWPPTLVILLIYLNLKKAAR